jgi:SecD/SecF fusion protein
MSYSRWKIALYAVPLLVGILFAVPNLLSRQQLDALPDWLPKRQVALGLDLRGGSHLLLEIDTAALIRAREEALADRVVQGLGNVGIHGAEATIVPMALAGSAVSSFAIPMLFGIVICASSSVFIAAPILLFLGTNSLRPKRRSEAAEPDAVLQIGRAR